MTKTRLPDSLIRPRMVGYDYGVSGKTGGLGHSASQGRAGTLPHLLRGAGVSGELGGNLLDHRSESWH